MWQWSLYEAYDKSENVSMYQLYQRREGGGSLYYGDKNY